MGKVTLKEDFLNNTSVSVIITTEEKIITYANPSTLKMSGYEEEELIGRNLDLLSLKEHNKKSFRAFKKTMEITNIWEGEVWNRRKSGEPFLTKRSIVKKKAEEDDSYEFVILSIDITKQREKEEQYNELVYKDIVTDLPNKHIFRGIVENTIKKRKRTKKKLAISFLNISGFYKINESFGYMIGDNLLKEVAQRLKWLLQEEAHLTRIERDLFALCLTDINDENDIARKLDSISQNFRRIPFIIEGQEVFISLNMGVSIYPEDGLLAKELFKYADTALSKARENNNGSYQFYTEDLNAKTFEKIVMETNLRKAIQRNEFVLYYQPQIDIKTKKLIGVEALIRWNHPELGLVPPMKFIPLAEETGLINPISDWVLNEACRQNKEWQDAGYPKIIMAVNLSTIQFQDKELVSKVQHTLKETGLDPVYLDLEVTESSIIKNIDQTIVTLKELKELGVKISIDDFGTGYSSLSYLAKLPFDTLKIDRSFIKDMHLNQEHKTITSTIIQLAHGLHLDIVAEGVDSEDQLDFLASENCEYYQGFYFSPPVPSEQILPFFSSKKRKKGKLN